MYFLLFTVYGSAELFFWSWLNSLIRQPLGVILQLTSPGLFAWQWQSSEREWKGVQVLLCHFCHWLLAKTNHHAKPRVNVREYYQRTWMQIVQKMEATTNLPYALLESKFFEGWHLVALAVSSARKTVLSTKYSDIIISDWLIKTLGFLLPLKCSVHSALSLNSYKMITVYFYTMNIIHSMDVVFFF